MRALPTDVENMSSSPAFRCGQFKIMVQYKIDGPREFGIKGMSMSISNPTRWKIENFGKSSKPFSHSTHF